MPVIDNPKRKVTEYRAQLQVHALNWDTHSKTSGQHRAFRGSDIKPAIYTPWRSSWCAVLLDVQQHFEAAPGEVNP